MPWIESHTSVERNPKVMMAATFLGISPVHMSGHLHALWHAALEHREDGDLSSWPDAMIAHQAMWVGSVEAFVQALRDNQLLDQDGLIHNWLEYAGRYVRLKYRHKPDRLRAIYDKHDQRHAQRHDPGQAEPTRVSPHRTGPDQPDQPNQPDQEEGGSGGGKWSARIRPEGMPDEIRYQDWYDFVEMRRRIKAPLTQRAVALMVAKLQKLEFAGHSPRDCLLQSVERAWRGVFPVREDSDPRPQGIKSREAAERRLGVVS